MRKNKEISINESDKLNDKVVDKVLLAPSIIFQLIS